MRLEKSAQIETGPVYMDTSALAKWYLNESNSDAFSTYISSVDIAAISSLTKLEMRSLLARKKRTKEISLKLENQIYSVFLRDINDGHITLYPVHDNYYERAVDLMSTLKLPLRSLDALHVVCAQGIGCKKIATADKVMIKVAEQLGIGVIRFEP